MSIFIYFILAVKTRLVDQRPKDYLLTEYLSTGFLGPMSPLGQYDEGRDHPAHSHSVCSTEKGLQNVASQNFKKGSFLFFILREGDKSLLSTISKYHLESEGKGP